MATAVQFTAASIGDAYRRFVPEPLGDVVLSGGGAKNPVLVDAISAALGSIRVTTFDAVFFDGEAKEAVAFALLGYLHQSGLSGNVPSATGARGPRVLGKLTPA
jgi:anhydro-N-acetylmuramic acid kinase